jgi:type II secretory pathway component PulM
MIKDIRSKWTAIEPDQRRLLSFAILMAAFAVFYIGGVRPAMKTIASTPAKIERGEAALSRIKGLAEQAGALQKTAKVSRAESYASLDASAKKYAGAIALRAVSDTAVATVDKLKGAELSAWITQARMSARAVPSDVDAARDPATGLWSGTITFKLPQGDAR